MLLGTWAQDAGFHPSNVLYVGIDGYQTKLQRSFGERNETWAFTYEEVLAGGKSGDSVGVWGSDSPFYYAFVTLSPAIALFDKSQFRNLLNTEDGNGGLRTEREYALHDGVTMDDAAIGIIHINS